MHEFKQQSTDVICIIDELEVLSTAARRPVAAVMPPQIVV